MNKEKNNIEFVRLAKLHNLLLQKIENEWLQKWYQFGPFQGIDKVPSLNAYLEALLYDIETTIKADLGLKATAEILISKDSLRRFIQQTQTNAKYKTRQTIALYIGYKGWDDFLEKNEAAINDLLLHTENIEILNDTRLSNEMDFENTLETNDSNNAVKKIYNANESFTSNRQIKKRFPIFIRWLLLPSFVLIGAILFFLFYFKSKKDDEFVFSLLPITEKNFPTVVKVQCNLNQSDSATVYIRQHNQPLDWYLKNDTRTYLLDESLNVTVSNGVVIQCDKPGLHHIELISKEKILKTLHVPIRAKDWYGIAYAPEQNNNKSFIYTNNGDWNKLKTKIGDNKLFIPKDFLQNELIDSRYRSDFFFSGDINMDIDSMSMEVEFISVDESESFDCKYFQMGFVNSNAEFSFIYSPISTCSTEGQILLARWNDSIPFPNSLKDVMNFNTEDAKHSAKFYFKNKKVYVELDKTLRYEKGYNIDLGKLEVFYISLNGDSRIKHFKVQNTQTEEIVYDKFFD